MTYHTVLLELKYYILAMKMNTVHGAVAAFDSITDEWMK